MGPRQAPTPTERKLPGCAGRPRAYWAVNPSRASIPRLKHSLVFFWSPSYRDTAASRARGVSRTRQIPMQRTMGQKGVADTAVPARPAPMVPGREPPHQTRPPGTTPASAAGLRHVSMTEDFNSCNPRTAPETRSGNPSGPIPSILRRPENILSGESQQGEFKAIPRLRLLTTSY